MSSPELLLDGLIFPEGPRWHDGRLWLSDMYAHRVIAVDESGQAETICEVPGRPSGLGWLPDGRLLVVSMKDRKVLRLEAGGLRVHADLAPLGEGFINDMVVDETGWAYVGSMGAGFVSGENPPPAEIILVQADGRARAAATGRSFPNGMVILPGGLRLVAAETYARRLTVFDIGEEGELSNPRTWADLGEHEPDGICLAEDGTIWVASLHGECFVRVEEGGEIVQQVDLPGTLTVACALGGDDGRTLYLCAATVDEAGRRAGAVFQYRAPSAER